MKMLLIFFLDSDEIKSVLPIIKVMGELVTPHLYSGMAAILCLLGPDIDQVLYDNNFTISDLFEDHSRGKCLLNHLEKIC
jgi:hypothetical protein